MYVRMYVHTYLHIYMHTHTNMYVRRLAQYCYVQLCTVMIVVISLIFSFSSFAAKINDNEILYVRRDYLSNIEILNQANTGH